MAKRIAEASEKFVGTEPQYKVDGEPLTKLELIVNLNWYNSMRDGKDAKKYLVEALKNSGVDKKVVGAFTDIADSDCRSIGYIARMISRGAKLSETDQAQFENGLTGLIAAAEAIAEEKKEVNTDSVQKPKVSVQDRIRAQADKIIGGFEEDLDQIIRTGDLDDVSGIRAYIVEEGVKGPQAKLILAWVEQKRKEYLTVQRSKDEQIKEGYSNLDKKDVKNILKWLDMVQEGTDAVVAAKKAARKPRKRKEKPVTQVVGAVKYLKSEPTLKAVSIDPTQIVGALQLWVFNTKTRKLGVFHATDESGLTVKGTTVKNFDEKKSIAKTVRKPEKKIPEVINAGKVALRHIMDEIKAKPSVLKGRLNEETLLLKVVK
jgi:hypothetical protein